MMRESYCPGQNDQDPRPRPQSSGEQESLPGVIQIPQIPRIQPLLHAKEPHTVVVVVVLFGGLPLSSQINA